MVSPVAGAGTTPPPPIAPVTGKVQHIINISMILHKYDNIIYSVIYVLINFPLGCDTTRWLYIHEGITFGGPEIAGVSTITECLDYCTASSSCFSFDINISEMKCYEHGTLTESAGTLAGVHQYRYACDGKSQSLPWYQVGESFIE